MWTSVARVVPLIKIVLFVPFQSFGTKDCLTLHQRSHKEMNAFKCHFCERVIQFSKVLYKPVDYLLTTRHVLELYAHEFFKGTHEERTQA